MILLKPMKAPGGGGTSSSSNRTISSFLASKKLRSLSIFSIGVLIYLALASDIPGALRKLQDQANEESFFDDIETTDSRTLSRRKKKKVAFMFMSNNGIRHDAIWEKWFLSGNNNSENDNEFEERASIYVHATDADSLRISPSLSPFFNERVIPGVQTEYYKNLLDAMLQLVLYAHSDPQNTHFVFVSDSSIPLKTFDEVYSELVNDTTSRFCLRTNERAHDMWGRFPGLDMPPEYHRESEMWSSMSRSHVSEIIKHLNSDLLVWQRANTVRNMASHGPYGGAPDETFLPTLLQKVIGTSAFNTCHGRVKETNEEDSKTDKYTGCCPTFVEWSDFPRHQVEIDGCLSTSASSPCLYKKIAIKDMKALYDAGYLFMRKIDENAVLVDESGTEIPWINHIELISTLNSLETNTDVV